MKTIEYRTLDKSEWLVGPWLDEPDKIQWPDAATGLPCLMVRGPLGSWCGYVGVAEAHPLYQIDYSAHKGRCDETCRVKNASGKYLKKEKRYHGRRALDSVIDAHGGLTFSNVCQRRATEAEGICHVPEPGEPHRVWWFGFDCAHASDLIPGWPPEVRTIRASVAASMGGYNYERDDIYRDVPYVREQVAQLAAQLAALA
jgi:hypothetical protein